MNTTQLINKKIAEGKCKVDVCELKSCNNNELLYKVSDGFICGDCLEKVSTKLSEMGMI